MKITICGTPGSGKGTIAKALAEKLSYAHYSVGDLRRQTAINKNMTLAQFNAWSLQNAYEGDTFFDEQTKLIGKQQDNFIFDGRLAFFFIPDSVKIFLSCDLDVAANRILKDKQTNNLRIEGASTQQELVQLMKERMASDKQRYEALYSVAIYDLDDFDIVIDTTKLTVDQVVTNILKILTTYQER